MQERGDVTRVRRGQDVLTSAPGQPRVVSNTLRALADASRNLLRHMVYEVNVEWQAVDVDTHAVGTVGVDKTIVKR